MPKILITIAGIRFEQDEGAKKRLNNFIDSYSKNNFEVTVLLFFSLQSIKYLFVHKKYFNPNAKWLLFPHIPIGTAQIISKISILYNQLVIAILDRLTRYTIIQSEVLGDTGRWVKRASFVTDFHGDSVSEAEYLYNGEKNWLISDLKKRQIDSIRYSDHLICVSTKLNELLQRATPNPTPHSIISCSVDVAKFQDAPKAKITLPVNKCFVLGYLGGLQKWQNIEAILYIFDELLKLDPRYFLQIYSNDNTDTISGRLKALGPSNVNVKPLKFNEVPSHTKTLDAGFLIRENHPLNIYSSPTKIGEYLASGTPIICTSYSGDYYRSIKHEKEGFVLQNTQPSNDEINNLHLYLQKVISNRNFYRKICIQSAKSKCWDNEFYNYLSKIEQYENQ